MRDLRVLNGYRDSSREVVEHYGSVGDETCGVFHMVSPITGRWMHVIAASGEGWDHVSVSMKDRPPIWAEMDHVKRLFFKDDEVVMQLHVPSISTRIRTRFICGGLRLLRFRGRRRS
jgi:hypothetical protein